MEGGPSQKKVCAKVAIDQQQLRTPLAFRLVFWKLLEAHAALREAVQREDSLGDGHPRGRSGQ
eukprot:5642640-Alexandrium_andersonii.AAC.1